MPKHRAYKVPCYNYKGPCCETKVAGFLSFRNKTTEGRHHSAQSLKSLRMNKPMSRLDFFREDHLCVNPSWKLMNTQQVSMRGQQLFSLKELFTLAQLRKETFHRWSSLTNSAECNFNLPVLWQKHFKEYDNSLEKYWKRQAAVSIAHIRQSDNNNGD